MNTEQEIQQIQRDIAELKAWKNAKTSQQISYPLDINSINVLGKYFLRVVNDLVLFFGGAAGRGFETLFIKQDNLAAQLQRDSSQIYIVDTTTDIFTAPVTQYPNDTQVSVFTTDTPPAPLVLGTTYYIVSTSGNTFKLSATSGGSAIDITTTGTGIQFIDYAV